VAHPAVKGWKEAHFAPEMKPAALQSRPIGVFGSGLRPTTTDGSAFNAGPINRLAHCMDTAQNLFTIWSFVYV
jgi:hypothetical protein